MRIDLIPVIAWFLLAGASLACAPAIADDAGPGPGQFQCDKVDEIGTEGYVSGLCIYETRSYGAQSYDDLLKYAQRKVTDFNEKTGSDPRVQLPSEFNRAAGKISWWLPSDRANQLLGEALRKADQPTSILRRDSIVVTLAMYSFDKTYARDLGLELGYFDGQVAAGTPAPATVFGSLNQGLFNVASGIGNPLASYLNFSMKAQVNKNHASVIDEFSFPKCDVGTYCTYRHQATYYVSTPALTPVSELLGLSVSYTPRLDANDPNLVQLQGLSISYATATGEKEAPVDTFVPYQGTHLTLHTNQVYTIAGERSSRDVRTGRLLSGGRQEGHTQFLLMISAKVIRSDEAGPANGFEFMDVRKVRYSQAERDRLNDPGLTLRDVLGSLELVCFPDHVNPDSADTVCGYTLKKMSAKYLDYRARITLKGPLPNRADAETIVQLGELYQGKGHYRLPMLDASDSRTAYQLRLELDRTSKQGRDLRKGESVKGMQFSFGYFPNTANPIDTNPATHPDVIRWLK